MFKYAVFEVRSTYSHQIFTSDVQLYPLNKKFRLGEGQWGTEGISPDWGCASPATP